MKSFTSRGASVKRKRVELQGMRSFRMNEKEKQKRGHNPFKSTFTVPLRE